MTRGEVWWVDYGIPFGSEPGYRRPSLIVQDDFLTNSNFQTVLAAPLTTNEMLANMRGNVFMPKGEAGLSKASVIVLPHMKTCDKVRFIEKIGKVSAKPSLRLTMAWH